MSAGKELLAHTLNPEAWLTCEHNGQLAGGHNLPQQVQQGRRLVIRPAQGSQTQRERQKVSRAGGGSWRRRSSG